MWSIASLDNSFLHHPWGLVCALVYIYLSACVWLWARKKWELASKGKASIALAALLVMTLLFGLVRQEVAGGGEVLDILGLTDMRRNWLFNLVLLYVATLLGWAVLDGITARKSLRYRGIDALHLGFYALLVVGLFGSADKFRVSAECVHDPWWIAAAIALWMMLIMGALTVLTTRFEAFARAFGKKSSRFPLGLLGLAVFALVAFIFVPSFRRSTVIPALQSPWFVPHVCAYILAYTIMALASIFALLKWIRGSRMSEDVAALDECVKMGWGFLTMGIAMGALWAKAAWGDYWMWDPKETWALVTWLAYLLIIHLKGRKDAATSYALVLFAFLLLQMCWYGINFLPAAQGVSVHLYR